MCTDSDLYNDGFVEREALICFNLARQTQVNEVEMDKHFRMQVIEFVEAIARAANECSYPGLNATNADHVPTNSSCTFLIFLTFLDDT